MNGVVFWIFLALGSVANAAEVYKWTDAEGRVHFGDKNSAPASGQKVDIKHAPRSATTTNESREVIKALIKNSPAVPPVPPSAAPASSTLHQEVAGRAQQCVPLAWELIDAEVQSHRMYIIKQITSRCPGVSFHCQSIKNRPDSRQCTLVPMTQEGGLVKHDWRSN